MIVITGATGALNGATVDHLLKRIDPDRVAVTVRDLERGEPFARRGVQVRRADYADPESLPAAFEGADQLLLVSSNDRGADTLALHGAAIDAAVRAGIGRLLYTSHQGATPRSPFAPARVHAATEALLAQCGLPWTSLRNGFYAHTLRFLIPQWADSGQIVVPADGPVSWTDRGDLAEAAALIVASEGAYEGPVTLTAGEAPTFLDIAAMAAEVSQRPVARVLVDPDAWVLEQVAHGQPEPAARFSLGIFEAAHAGLFATVDPLLPALLGRKARSVQQLLEDQGRHPSPAATPSAPR